VQTDTIQTVLAALLGVEIIVRTAIVLIDVPVFNKHPLGLPRNLRLEALSYALRSIFCVQDLDETFIAFGTLKINPVVGWQ